MENIDRSDSIRGVYVNQGVALRTELNQGTMQRRGASPPPVSETNLLVKTIFISLGMMYVTFLWNVIVGRINCPATWELTDGRVAPSNEFICPASKGASSNLSPINTQRLS